MDKIWPLLQRNGYEEKVDSLYRTKVINVEAGDQMDDANGYLRKFSESDVGQITFWAVADLLQSLNMEHTLLTFTVETGFKLDEPCADNIKSDLISINMVKQQESEPALEQILRWYMAEVDKKTGLSKKEGFLNKLIRSLNIEVLMRNTELPSRVSTMSSLIRMSIVGKMADYERQQRGQRGSRIPQSMMNASKMPQYVKKPYRNLQPANKSSRTSSSMKSLRNSQPVSMRKSSNSTKMNLTNLVENDPTKVSLVMNCTQDRQLRSALGIPDEKSIKVRQIGPVIVITPPVEGDVGDSCNDSVKSVGQSSNNSRNNKTYLAPPRKGKPRKKVPTSSTPVSSHLIL